MYVYGSITVSETITLTFANTFHPKFKIFHSLMYLFQLPNMAGLPGHTTPPVTSTVTKAESDTVTMPGTLSHVQDHLIFMASRGKMFHAPLVTVQVF